MYQKSPETQELPQIQSDIAPAERGRVREFKREGGKGEGGRDEEGKEERDGSQMLHSTPRS